MHLFSKSINKLKYYMLITIPNFKLQTIKLKTKIILPYTKNHRKSLLSSKRIHQILLLQLIMILIKNQKKIIISILKTDQKINKCINSLQRVHSNTDGDLQLIFFRQIMVQKQRLSNLRQKETINQIKNDFHYIYDDQLYFGAVDRFILFSLTGYQCNRKQSLLKFLKSGTFTNSFRQFRSLISYLSFKLSQNGKTGIPFSICKQYEKAELSTIAISSIFRFKILRSLMKIPFSNIQCYLKSLCENNFFQGSRQSHTLLAQFP